MSRPFGGAVCLRSWLLSWLLPPARRVELAAFLPLGARKLADEVFVDATADVEIDRGRNLGNLRQQFLEQRAGEQVVGFRQRAGETQKDQAEDRSEYSYAFSPVLVMQAINVTDFGQFLSVNQVVLT